MDFQYSDPGDLIRSLEPEVAKALAEIRHAEEDLEKATSRLKFTLAAIHALKGRFIDETDFRIQNQTQTNQSRP